MNYYRINCLLLLCLLTTPISYACGLVIHDDGKAIWFTKTDTKPSKYYAAVLPKDNKGTALKDLRHGRPLGQDHDKRAELPEHHGVLLLVSRAEADDTFSAFQIEALEADGKKGFSNYGEELQTASTEFKGEGGSKVCRWEW